MRDPDSDWLSHKIHVSKVQISKMENISSPFENIKHKIGPIVTKIRRKPYGYESIKYVILRGPDSDWLSHKIHVSKVQSSKIENISSQLSKTSKKMKSVQ